jgi:hypothetical protein
MPTAIYDSGWVPAASGSINAAVIASRGFDQLHVIYAASGTEGAASASLAWVAGAETPIPWGTPRNPINYPTSPRITGALSVSNPGANDITDYVMNAYNTASLTRFVPMEINVGLTPSGSSWARIIVEGA